MYRCRVMPAACLVPLLLLLLSTPSLHAAFIYDYRDAVDFGFYDPTHGAARRGAFEWACGQWDDWMRGANPVPIRVNAGWSSMGSGVLGSAQPTRYIYRNNSAFPYQDTYYGDTLANFLTGTDLSGSWHMFLTFNTDFSWNYDYTLPSGGFSGLVDFASVAMHEVGHGMGFFHSFSGTGAWGVNGSPFIYDRFLQYEDGTLLISENPAPEGVSGGVEVYWGGSSATSANNGDRVRIYTPNTWASGSSLSHIDHTNHPSLLMNFSIGYNDERRTIDPLMDGMLFDIGWEVPEPGTVALMAVGLMAVAITLRRRRQQQQKAA